MSVAVGNLPSWLAAVGTVGTLIAALLQIRSERARFVAQQAADRQERRYAQARLISAWMKALGSDPPTDGTPHSYMKIALANGSAEPVYNVLVTVVDVQGTIPHQRENFGTNNRQYIQDATLSILPPGRWSVRVDGAFGAMGSRPGAEVAFTDRSRVHWVRRTWGAPGGASCRSVPALPPRRSP